MKLKKGVKLDNLKPQTVVAMMIADSIYKKHNQELIVTAGSDGNHMKGSKHYTGEAFDSRTSCFNDDERVAVHIELKQELDELYDILDEIDHFHIEFDPK